MGILIVAPVTIFLLVAIKPVHLMQILKVGTVGSFANLAVGILSVAPETMTLTSSWRSIYPSHGHSTGV